MFYLFIFLPAQICAETLFSDTMLVSGRVTFNNVNHKSQIHGNLRGLRTPPMPRFPQEKNDLIKGVVRGSSWFINRKGQAALCQVVSEKVVFKIL